MSKVALQKTNSLARITLLCPWSGRAGEVLGGNTPVLLPPAFDRKHHQAHFQGHRPSTCSRLRVSISGGSLALKEFHFQGNSRQSMEWTERKAEQDQRASGVGRWPGRRIKQEVRWSSLRHKEKVQGSEQQ